MNASTQDQPIPSIESVPPGDVIPNDGGNLGSSLSGRSTPSRDIMTPAASTPEAGRVLLNSTGDESSSAAHAIRDSPAQTNGLENGFDNLHISPGPDPGTSPARTSGLENGIDNLHLSPGPDASRESLSPRRSRRQRSNSPMIAAMHEVHNEERPENGFHRPEFQQALADAKSLMARVTSTLASSVIHSDVHSTLYRLHNEASRLAEFRCAPARRIGCVGDSGVGELHGLPIPYRLCH
jgi:hypothetical protein